MRGTEKSEGNFTMWQQDSDDSQDLANWIVSQPWSNGKIMTFGASADGLAEIQQPMNQPNYLAAQYIAWCPATMYDILFPNGCYKKETTENWLFGLTMPNPDVVYDNVATVYANEAHTAYWGKVEPTQENSYQFVDFPTAFWAGWYDLFLVGTLQLFDGYNTKSQPSVRNTAKITIDPLGHCLEGAEYFQQNAVEGRTALVLSQIYEVYGIFETKRSAIKNITFYVMSSNDEAGLAVGEYWTSIEEFPAPTMTDYYLNADKTSSTKLPVEGTAESSSYKMDPNDYIATYGGNNLPKDIGGSIPCGPWDQSPLDARTDILNFNTDVFTDATAMTGPLFANLFVSSDAIDTDFMVKIMDVYPTGESRIIQDNAIRMRWRDMKQSPTNEVIPQYMTKDTIYNVNINIWNTSYIIAPGHSLRFAVSSSNNPRFQVNANNGILLSDPAFPGENITATNTLYHSPQYPSKFVLPIVNKRHLPEVHVIKEVQTAYPHLTDDVLAKFSKNIDQIVARMAPKSKK
jgi:putative CocE/NonD family hydrolase